MHEAFNKVPRVDAEQFFYRKRHPSEVDIVNVMANEFLMYYGLIAEVNFRKFPLIVEVAELNPITQRIQINTFFRSILYRYRSFIENEINNNKDLTSEDIERMTIIGTHMYRIMPFITEESDTEDWVKTIREHVIPFFKQERLLG